MIFLIKEKGLSETWDQECSVEKAKEGDRFIRPDSKKVYVAVRVVLDRDWVVLKEEGSDRHFLTSQESLETWIKYKRDESG